MLTNPLLGGGGAASVIANRTPIAFMHTPLVSESNGSGSRSRWQNTTGRANISFHKCSWTAPFAPKVRYGS
jgi:hypothetical protein